MAINLCEIPQDLLVSEVWPNKAIPMKPTMNLTEHNDRARMSRMNNSDLHRI